MIKIVFTVIDEETLKEYSDVHPDLILDDFLNNFNGWKELGDFKVTKDKK